jgi:hypothetical protein
MLTVRDLIGAAGAARSGSLQRPATEYFNGLVQPTESEKTLNGYKMRHRRPIDAEGQVYKP